MDSPTLILGELQRLLEGALKHDSNPAIQRLGASCTFSPDCDPHGVGCFRGEVEKRYCDSHTEDRQTVEGLAGAYLPRTMHWIDPSEVARFPGDETRVEVSGSHVVGPVAGDLRLVVADLTDPGTAHGLLVGFALYLGLDPGEDGLGVSWQPVTDGTREERVVGWFVGVKFDARYFVLPEHLTGDDDEIAAPEVASEPDTRKALVLAIKHVLARA